MTPEQTRRGRVWWLVVYDKRIGDRKAGPAYWRECDAIACAENDPWKPSVVKVQELPARSGGGKRR